MKNILRPIGMMYKNLGYIALSFVLFVSVMLIFIWLPSLSLIKQFFSLSNVSFGQKVIFLFNSLGSFISNMNVGSEVLMVVIALLFAVQVSLTIYYFRTKHVFNKGNNSMGIIGVLSGVLGLGCASCGSVLLSAVIGAGATTGFLSVLPFGGYEFGILAIILLVFSIILISRKLQDSSEVCSV